MKCAIFGALLLLAACGRVGDPRPPIIRVLQKIDTLKAAQNGYTIVLSWTNPARYVDGNTATDTGVVHVFRNNLEIGTVAAAAAGQPQSFSVPVVRNSVGSTLIFSIQLVLPKAGKPSPVSNEASIRPEDVPGVPRNLSAIVNLGKIVLTWDPPELNPGLVKAYAVQRSDKPAPSVVPTPRFEDVDIEAGKTYIYAVTAVGGTNSQIAGDGAGSLPVVATDKLPPATPTGLEIQVFDNTAVLSWAKNTEPDLKGYRLFRSDRPEPIVTTVANAYIDAEYVPGRGLSYHLVAEDVSGNPSQKSEAKSAP